MNSASAFFLVLALSFAAGAIAQCTTPSFSSGPTIDVALQDRFSVRVQLSSPGQVACVLVAAGAPVPSDVQVQSLLDGAGNTPIASAVQYARFPARFFELSLTGLTASTNYNVHCVVWDGSCLGTVSSVSGTTDANPSNCVLNITAEPLAPAFQPKPESRIETGEFAGVYDDIFQATFKASNQFQTVAYEFSTGSSAYCNFNSSLAASFPLWSVVRGPNSCDVRHIARFNFTKALGECFVRTDTATEVVYDAIVRATTVQYRGTIRGSPQTRTVKTAMRLQFRLPLFVNVSSELINVTGAPDPNNGQAVFLHELIEQIFDTDSYDTNLKLFTSLPYPYELIALNATLSTDPFYTLSGLHQVFAAGLTCGVPGKPCHQQWAFVLRPTAGQCEIAATFNVTFMVNCSASYNGRCPGYPRYITPVVYRLATNDFCLKVVSEGEATATMLPYDSPSFLAPSYNFIFNQRAYFETNTQVIMTLPLASTSLVQVVVSSFNHKETLLGNDPRLHIFPLDSQFPGRLRFDFEVNSGVVKLSDPDSPQLVNLNATLALTYAGLNAETPHYVQLSTSLPAHQLLSASGFQLLDINPSTSASTIFFSKSSSQVRDPETSPAETASSATSSVPIIVGAAVGSALAMILVALVVYRLAVRKIAPKGETSEQEMTSSPNLIIRGPSQDTTATATA